MARDETTCRINMKWDVALRLMALLHVVVLQNRLLRGETPEIRVLEGASRVFTVAGGSRSGPVECSWEARSMVVGYGPVAGGGAGHFELVVSEDAAAELVVSLAESLARSGTRTARQKTGAT